MTAPELLIVGAGPAGLSAAEITSGAGIRTLVVDEYSTPGGQYYRQPLTPSARTHTSRQQREGAKILDAVARAGPSLSGDTVAYAVEDGTLHAVQRDSGAISYSAPLIVATGATERVVPVPGWTLPGVVTCGGAQAMAKAYGVPIGRRVLVAGSGPFLLPVAATLVELGARVVAVVEAQWPSISAGLALSLSPGRLREAAGYLYTLTRARVPLLFGHAVARIDGTDAVIGASIVPLTAGGEVRSHRTRRFEVDAVALSDGFVPTADLAELAGGEVRYAPATRSYLVAVDPQTGAMATRNRWAAGACVEEMCSAPLASATGALAGFAAIEALRGPLSRRQQTRRTRMLYEARRHRAFAGQLAAAYPTRSAWYRRVADDTIVCRCEDVRARDIRAAATAGAGDVNAIKRWTRAGMGLCQGRTCQSAVIELAAAATHRSAPDVGRFRPRPPVRPIPLTAFGALPPGMP